jgi:hypothetical protein
MFDSVGSLICKPNLATAQALCLLQMHETIAKPSWTTRYHGKSAPISRREIGQLIDISFSDIALQILKDLSVQKPDIPVITPIPSLGFINSAIERECVRRVFWLIHFIDLMSSIFFKTSPIAKETELTLRLPADETSFELAVHSTLPGIYILRLSRYCLSYRLCSISEYLYLPAPHAQYASEFGHLIRIVSIYANVESKMDCKGKLSRTPCILSDTG